MTRSGAIYLAALSSTYFAPALVCAQDDVCNSVRVVLEGQRDIAFGRDFTVTLQEGEINGMGYYENENYSLSWQQQECKVIRVSGCEDVQHNAMAFYTLESNQCDGKHMYMSIAAYEHAEAAAATRYYLFFQEEYNDWNTSTEGCGASQFNAYADAVPLNSEDPLAASGWLCNDPDTGVFTTYDLSLTCEEYNGAWVISEARQSVGARRSRRHSVYARRRRRLVVRDPYWIWRYHRA